jgi:hypothetical protein
MTHRRHFMGGGGDWGYSLAPGWNERFALALPRAEMHRL